MTDTALVPFLAGKPPARSNAFANLPSNLPDRQTVPTLGVTGKIWSISKDGATQKLMRRDSDGEEIPVSIFKAVIVDTAPNRGRAFYEGSYDPNKTTAPRCWSDNGKVPATAVPEPVATACNGCPNSVKGSKVNESGYAGVACAVHRMLAVVPAAKLDFTPLRLKLAITSLWDSESPDMEAQGWYSYDKYVNFLKANGCYHTGEIVTKMRFDANAAYPKIFFSADAWLNEDQKIYVASRVMTPEVQKLLDGSWTPAGADGVSTAPAPTPAPAPAPAPEPEPEPEPVAAAVVEEDDGDDIDWGGGATVLAQDDPAPVTKPARAARAKPAAIAAEVAPAVSTELPSGLDDLLNGWAGPTT